MSIRKIAMLAALCALAAMSLAASASAATFVHSGSTTGPAYSGALNGSLVTGTTAVLTSSLGNISCTTSSFAGNLSASSGNPSVSGTLTSLTFGTTSVAGPCTDTIPFVTVNDCFRSASSTITATATGAGTGNLTIPVNGITVDCVDVNMNLVCRFVNSGASQTITGAVSVSGGTSRIAFTNAQVTSTGGLCPSTAGFTATYGPITGTGGVNVFLNTV